VGVGVELMEGERLVESQLVRVVLPPLPPVLNDLIRGSKINSQPCSSIPFCIHYFNSIHIGPFSVGIRQALTGGLFWKLRSPSFWVSPGGPVVKKPPFNAGDRV